MLPGSIAEPFWQHKVVADWDTGKNIAWSANYTAKSDDQNSKNTSTGTGLHLRKVKVGSFLTYGNIEGQVLDCVAVFFSVLGPSTTELL